MEKNRSTNLALRDAKSDTITVFDYYDSKEKQTSIHHYWDILMRRKWWAIIFFLGVVIPVTVISFLMTPIYKATTILQITQDNPSAIMGDRDPFGSILGYESQSRFYETQFLILHSLPIAYNLIDSLNLTERDDFNILKKKNPNLSMSDLRSKYAETLLKKLEFTPLKKSFLVEASFQNKDKHFAQKVVNAISQEYMKLCMETRRKSYDMIKSWLEKELHQLGAKVEDSERKLYDHGIKKDFLSIEGKDNTIVKKYLNLNILLTKAQSERMAREAQFNQIKEKGMDAPPITNNILIQKLREEAVAQEAKVSSLNKIYDVNYPQLQAEKAKLQELKLRMNDEIKRIRSSIEAEYEAALRTENMLQEAFESQKQKVGHLQQNLVEHHLLKRDMQTNEQLYQGLLARMKEANISGTMVASNIAVISPADLPIKPFKPKKLLNILVASIIGLVGGICLAVFVDSIDDSICTVSDLELNCQVPMLGLVPLFSNNSSQALIPGGASLDMAIIRDPKSLEAESFYNIATSLYLSLPGSAPKIIMVTSSNPSEGKSTITANLASVLAAKKATLIIDADLRKPKVHSIFRDNLEPGLSNYLSGQVALGDIIKASSVPNLFYITAGTIPPKPVELLLSENFVELINSLREDFQHLVIDTPPVLAFADARAISSHVDGVILVVKHNYSHCQSTRLTVKLLEQVNARIFGAVLNMAVSERVGYGPYAKYYANYANYYKESSDHS